MASVPLVQVNNNLQSAKKQSVSKPKNNESNEQGNFLSQLMNSQKKQVAGKEEAGKLTSAAKLTDKGKNAEKPDLKLSKKELAKLKKLLTKAGLELSSKEIKELLESIGSLYQQLIKLDVNELSFDSAAQREEFIELKNKISKLMKEFGTQIQQSKKYSLKELQQNQKSKQNLQQESGDIRQQKSGNVAQQIQKRQSAFLSKLIEIKKSLADFQTKIQSFTSDKSSQNEQLAKLISKLGNVEEKLSKFLQKNRITTKEQSEFTKQHTKQSESKSVQGVNSQNGKQESLSGNNFKGKQSSEDNTQSLSAKQNLKGKIDMQFKAGKGDLLKQGRDPKQILKRLQSFNQELKSDSVKGKKLNLDETEINIKEQTGIKSSLINKTTYLSTNNMMTNRVDQVKIIDQITQQLKQLRASGKKELTLQLEPDFLGKVNLKMAVEEGVMTAKLMAENQQVKKLLEGQLFKLRNALAEKNIELEEVTVDVGTGDEFDDFQNKNHFGQKEFSQRNNSQERFNPELLELEGIEDFEEPIAVSPLNNQELNIDSIDYMI